MTSQKYDRLIEMSEDDFQKYRATDEYREINTNKDSAVRGALAEVINKRRSNRAQRKRTVKALYNNPEVMSLIEDIRAYRLIRIKEGFLSLISKDADNRVETQGEMTKLSSFRRSAHNRALTSFYRLVEATSSLISLRNEDDIYQGRLMLVDETLDKYGNHDIRQEMTDGMFEFLYLFENTSRSDWDKIKEELGVNNPDKKPISNMQKKLQSDTHEYRLKEAPRVDDFDITLYEDYDKYR